MAVVPPDYTRAIVSSLFSSPPGSTTPRQFSYFLGGSAHTWTDDWECTQLQSRS